MINHIVNKGSIIANAEIDTTKLSRMYFAKNFINHHKGNINARKGKINFKHIYL